MSRKLLTGIIVGAAVGAALGMLFAPDRGKETRKKIKRKADRLGHDAVKAANHLGDKIKNKANTIKSDAENLMAKHHNSATDSLER